MALKGLIVSTYRTARLGDCTNGGVTSRFDEFVVVDPAIDEIFEANEKRPALKIVRRNIGGKPYVHAEPLEPVNNKTHMGYTFGGNFVYTSDSRFSALNNSCPIPVHDRKDTWEAYKTLSR